ncbi:MAG: glutaredoxin family protein [Candidatus Hydrogenedens sp.]|nr:glutaredoxin family protein [Candidatus Hydrogenedens sp.]
MSEEVLIVYSAALCGDCQLLKAFLDERGIRYENRDIRANPEYGVELEERTGKLGVPYVVHNGEWKRGYLPGEPFSAEFAEDLFGLR